ncbi:MAG: hypothetical protein J0H01_33560 [Rhizobiales bacterium]|nr:hypothetical protein [Hyphomicrobiales bacterium]
MTPAKAYDLEMLPISVPEVGERGKGWCFGLPPGLTPEQWPLDRFNGFPLRHAFTLLLPGDYRCHGPDIVALSFFGISNDHHDGGLTVNEPVASALRAAGPPSDPLLRRLWQAERSAHPRLFRMTDVLDREYAVILLTQAEFDGRLCPPPQHGYPAQLHASRRPLWLELGTARAYWDDNYFPSSGTPVEQYHLYKALGGVPPRDLAFNRGIRWSPRASDPNAGKAPREAYGAAAAENGYTTYYYWQDGKIEAANFRQHDWAQGHGERHIGGTMRPAQGIPFGFSAHYVEFDEAFGGFNFGGGIAQLDFQAMKFDWACG